MPCAIQEYYCNELMFLWSVFKTRLNFHPLLLVEKVSKVTGTPPLRAFHKRKTADQRLKTLGAFATHGMKHTSLVSW